MNKGEIIVFPTDTVYGLGCKFDDILAIEKIYEIKKRNIDKLLPVLCSNLKQIEKFAVIDYKLINLLSKFWPGALTVVFDVKEKIGNYENTIAVRIPNSKIALELINKYGPLATTSCNISGEKELNSIKEIKEKFSNLIDYYVELNEDDVMSNIPSTVIKYKNNKLEILREGFIKKEELEKYV